MIYRLPLPETTNHAYATNQGRWYKTTKQKAWEQKAYYELKKQVRTQGMTGSTGPVSLDIWWYVKRDRDIDGGIKAVMDLLERSGFYANDSQVKRLRVTKNVDKEQPRCEFEIGFL